MAWRNVRRNRRRSLITFSAIGLGLTLIILSWSLIDVAYGGFMENIIRIQTGHLEIRPIEEKERRAAFLYLPKEQADRFEAELQALPEVQVVTQRFVAGGMATTAQGWANVSIMGIDPANEGEINTIVWRATPRYLEPDDRNQALIGKALAQDLGLQEGDRFTLLVRAADGSTSEGEFVVKAVYSTGFAEYDRSNVFIPLSYAQRVWNLRGATSIVAMLGDAEAAVPLAAWLRSPQGLAASSGPKDRPYEILDWREANSMMLQLMETESGMMAFIGLIIVVIAAFGVLNTMLMSVYERTREVGVMLAMGVLPYEVMVLFVFEGGIIGFFGAMGGSLVGWAIVAYLNRVGLDFGSNVDISAFYAMPIELVYYPEFMPDAAVVFFVFVLVVSLAASFYPAWSASRLQPAQALRFT